MERQQSCNRAQVNINIHPLIERFAFPDKDGVPFDKVRIQCLCEREDDVPEIKYNP